MAFPRSSPSDRGQCMACASRRPGPLSMRWWPCASPFHRANGSPAMVDSGVAEAEADAIESERACVCVPRESRRVRCLGGPTRHLAVVVADRSLDTLEMSLECVRREAVRMRRMLTDPVTTHSSGALHLPLCGLSKSQSRTLGCQGLTAPERYDLCVYTLRRRRRKYGAIVDCETVCTMRSTKGASRSDAMVRSAVYRTLYCSESDY